MASPAGSVCIENLGRPRTSSMPGDVVEDSTLLFAIPKKGRLHEEVMKVLAGAGLNAKRPDRLDVALCKELPVKLVFLPAADIPAYVIEGSVDLGISGSDVLEECLSEADAEDAHSKVKVLLPLGFGKCDLCVQAPKVLQTTDPTMFVGKRVVTSFPNLARRFFEGVEQHGRTEPLQSKIASEKDATANGVTPGSSKCKTTIKVVSGSVEAACGLGLADAIVDLVETGTTMRAAGLEIVSKVFQSEALLFQQVASEENNTKKELIRLILQRIRGYMTATKHLMLVCNCHNDDLEKICAVVPGKRAPTITALAEPNWQSVSSLVEKSKLNQVMDRLTEAGAKDVLCFSLANSRA
eukprot:TRINITY_DN18436_c0_g1_i1.p1 TRINITY_DN18436_c0_g1~~TRINITY_DN18436_c0_g1_i1.p1  ORF type:complete len:353 (-),score=72.10 TRINITY_DN18436_c0_g1_i1:264-1322(-)